MKKSLLSLFVIMAMVIVSLTTGEISVKAASLGITFEEQFSDAHTAEVIAAEFGKLPTDDIDSVDTSVTFLDLRSKGLTNIDGIELFTALTGLYLNDNELTALPDRIDSLVNLKDLIVYNNKISSLPNGILDLVELTTLNVSGNQLTSIPDGLNAFVNLKYFHLSGNKLTSLPDSLGNIPQLISLNIDDNQLTGLPASFVNLSLLETLNADKNQLTILPVGFNNLINLTNLYLSKNEFAIFPEDITSLTKLKNLTITDNQLTSIPESIGNLINLNLLYLNANQLTSLPDSMGTLANLNTLYLIQNQITSLPDSIGGLVNLTTLALWDNELSTLPISIGDLTSLNALYMHNNQLISLPESIGNLTNLKILYAYNNQLTSLPNSFINLNGLTTLFLHYNLLPSDFGEQLTALGQQVAGGAVISQDQDHLQLIAQTDPIVIKSQANFDAINKGSLVDTTYLYVLSSMHEFAFENYVDENQQSVSLTDYLNNGNVKKSGIIYAQVRANGVGLFPNNSDNAVTTDYVALSFIGTYDLSFDLNGGTGTKPATQKIECYTLGVAPTEPVREGYTFKGWNTQADGKGTAWDFATSIMPDNEVVLYAQWEKNVDPIVNYILRFDLNGGQGVAPKGQILNEGQKAVKPATPLRDGYIFKGWNTAKDGSGETWNFDVNTMPARGITLYAQWIKKDLPKTGDSSNAILLGALLFLAGITLVGVAKKKYSK